jgi:hypothetical protein
MQVVKTFPAITMLALSESGKSCLYGTDSFFAPTKNADKTEEAGDAKQKQKKKGSGKANRKNKQKKNKKNQKKI